MFTLCLAVGSIIAVVPAGTSLADPPSTLPDAPYHRHFTSLPTETWFGSGRWEPLRGSKEILERGSVARPWSVGRCTCDA